MIFLPKCRAFYVVLEKGHGAGEKGMALEKKGMAWRHAKTGKGKHYLLKIKFSPCMPINYVMQGNCLFSDISRPAYTALKMAK